MPYIPLYNAGLFAEADPIGSHACIAVLQDAFLIINARQRLLFGRSITAADLQREWNECGKNIDVFRQKATQEQMFAVDTRGKTPYTKILKNLSGIGANV